MKFNPLKRGAKRQANTEEQLYAVLDATYYCNLAIVHQNTPMIIPMAYGRKNDLLYFHGSLKNFVLTQALQSENCCVSIFIPDGIVLAQTLFNTGFNYRSAVIYGKMEEVTQPEERVEALEIITENIIPDRWKEVIVGTTQQINATMVTKLKIDTVTVKIREGGPSGDEDLDEAVWSGVIPLHLVSGIPEFDQKRTTRYEKTPSIQQFYSENQIKDGF